MPLRIPPPLLMLMAAGLMWLMSHWWPLGSWIAAPWNRLGGILIVGGLAVTATAALRFRRAGTTLNPLDPSQASSLVVDGLFLFSRNPMYLGLTVLLAGWAVWLGSASPWIVVALFAAAINFLQIIPEERALAGRFGEPYAAYQRSVRRWFGRSK